jgi:hypothetical protein
MPSLVTVAYTGEAVPATRSPSSRTRYGPACATRTCSVDAGRYSPGTLTSTPRTIGGPPGRGEPGVDAVRPRGEQDRRPPQPVRTGRRGPPADPDAVPPHHRQLDGGGGRARSGQGEDELGRHAGREAVGERQHAPAARRGAQALADGARRRGGRSRHRGGRRERGVGRGQRARAPGQGEDQGEADRAGGEPRAVHTRYNARGAAGWRRRALRFRRPAPARPRLGVPVAVTAGNVGVCPTPLRQRCSTA